MDPSKFEDLCRRFATSASRRVALAGIAGGFVAAVGAKRDAAADVAPAGAPIVHCKIPGQKCTKDKTCCSRHCNGGLCSCSQRGRRCWQPLEGGLCCSGRCRSGKCK
jgi:hypothetical protein